MTKTQVDAYKKAMPEAKENEPMARHTSFRIGGAARLYVVAATAEALLQAVRTAEDLGIPFFLYGGGSNLLVSDDGYDGVVIQAANRTLLIEGCAAKAEAGTLTALVARKSVEAGLTGFEWAIGVPGTIGGAIFGNAGCYGGEMRDAVSWVDAYRLADGKRVRLSNADCGFGYRESRFKREPYVLLGCELVFAEASDPSSGKARMEEIIRMRKEKQPLEQSSCGCVFKNHDFQDDRELEILKRRISDIPASMLAQKRLSAGWLIDRVGMTGERIGNVEISRKHGNFFVIHGQGRAQDVLALVSLVKKKVRDALGIALQEELQYLGFEKSF